MKKSSKNNSFEPFGNEWEKMMMRFSKKFLIQQYKKTCLKLQEIRKIIKDEKPF